jgi:hypothetical protein
MTFEMLALAEFRGYAFSFSMEQHNAVVDHP